MQRDQNERRELEAQLARSEELARQFPHDPTAKHLRELQSEIRERLRKLASNGDTVLNAAISSQQRPSVPGR
jgi:hypothetical protein